MKVARKRSAIRRPLVVGVGFLIAVMLYAGAGTAQTRRPTAPPIEEQLIDAIRKAHSAIKKKKQQRSMAMVRVSKAERRSKSAEATNKRFHKMWMQQVEDVKNLPYRGCPNGHSLSECTHYPARSRYFGYKSRALSFLQAKAIVQNGKYKRELESYRRELRYAKESVRRTTESIRQLTQAKEELIELLQMKVVSKPKQAPSSGYSYDRSVELGK